MSIRRLGTCDLWPPGFPSWNPSWKMYIMHRACPVTWQCTIGSTATSDNVTG